MSIGYNNPKVANWRPLAVTIQGTVALPRSAVTDEKKGDSRYSRARSGGGEQRPLYFVFIVFLFPFVSTVKEAAIALLEASRYRFMGCI